MVKDEPTASSTDGEKQIEESVVKNERKSQREKKNKRSFSPEVEGESKKKRKKPSKPYSYTSSSRPCDLLPDGEPFCCKLCKSPYVTNPHAKGVRKSKRSRHVPLPKKRLDSLGREILVCNACCQILDRQIRPQKRSKELTVEERNKYLEDAKTFAKSLAETLNEPEAEKLYCPVSVYKICGCLQKSIQGKDSDEEALESRVTELLDLMKEAARLREQKVYNAPESLGTSQYSRRKLKYIGYGNGHKKSKAFEEFVLDKRRYLKEDMRLCERATQRVLLYSNNFLHKKLKTEERPCRITRTKGKAALGKLHDIETLHQQTCCIDGCVRLSLTHPNLLKTWRERAISGQMEARKVIAEMLTPAGGYRLNCYQFVSMVTGCALTTIGKVNNQIRETGGKQDPPEHGMKRLWNNNLRNRTDTAESSFVSDSYTCEPLLVPVQPTTGQEGSSEMLRTSQNQDGPTPANILMPVPQGEVRRIAELMKRQQELQQQQQIVQYQIQQALGQSPGLPQSTGWIASQIVGPFPQTIGPANSFVPAGNIPQPELPQYIPPISSFPLVPGGQSQYQPLPCQTVATSKLDVSAQHPIGSTNPQSQTLSNQFVTNVNEVPVFRNQSYPSSGYFLPVMGQSGCNTNQIQPCKEDNNPSQPQITSGDGTPNESKDQTMIGPQNTLGSDSESNPSHRQQFSLDSNTTVPSDSNSIVCNFSQNSDVNQSQSMTNLGPTSYFDPGSTTCQPMLKQVLIGHENPHALSEFMHQPLVLSPLDPTFQQVQVEKQGFVSNCGSEDMNSQASGNLNDFGKSPQKIMIAVVDQNGVTHQLALNNTFDPQLFSITNNSSAVLDGGSLDGSQISIVAEQRLDQDHSNLTSASVGTQPMVQQQSISNQHQTDENKSFREESKSQTEKIEETSIKNRNLKLTTSNNMDIVNEANQGEPVTQKVVTEVVDKSTNTVAEQLNDHFVRESNTGEMVSAKKAVRDAGENEFDAYSDSLETDRSCDMIGVISKPVTMTLSKNQSKTFRSSGNDPVDTDNELSDNKSSCSQNARNSNGQRKPKRKQKRSRHLSKEHGFQKFHSKNGKVFLQSNSQSRTEFKELPKDSEDLNSDNCGLHEESYVMSSHESVLETSSVRCASKTREGTESQNLKSKTDHVSEKVKSIVRNALNIPILPKTLKPTESDVRIPVQLQPIQSSLFVMPQKSQNITSLLHMTKSRVQVQPSLNADNKSTDTAINLPAGSVVNEPVSKALNKAVTPSYSPKETCNDRERNLSLVTKHAQDQIEVDSSGLNRNFSRTENVAVSVVDNIALGSSESDIEQANCSLRGNPVGLMASQTGLTPEVRNLNIDFGTNFSTNLVAIGNVPSAFLPVFPVGNPIQNMTSPPTLSSPVKDQFLTVVKRTDGQSILTIPFNHSMEDSAVSGTSSKSLKQKLSNKGKKSCSTAVSHTTMIPLMSSATPKAHLEVPEEHSPTHLVELSSDLIQKGVQEELNMLKNQSD